MPSSTSASASRPPRRRPRPAPGAPAAAAATACPSAAWIPARCSQALLGHPEPGQPRVGHARSTTRPSARDTVEGSEHGAAVLRVKGTTQGACHGHRRRRQRSALIDPWLGAALAVAECARNVAVTGARPLGVTNCLNFGDPSDPRRSGSSRRRSAAWATRAGRWACRSRAATSACTTSRPLGRHRAHRPDRRRRPARRHRAARVGPRSGGEGDVVVLLGETVARAWPARSTRRSPARRPTIGRRRSTWRARRRSRSWLPRGRGRRGLLALGAGRQRRRPGRGARRVRHLVGRRRGPASSPSARAAPSTLFGESPSRVVVTRRADRLGRARARCAGEHGAAAPAPGRRSAATGCASGSSARARRAPPRSAARASPTTST